MQITEIKNIKKVTDCNNYYHLTLSRQLIFSVGYTGLLHLPHGGFMMAQGHHTERKKKTKKKQSKVLKSEVQSLQTVYLPFSCRHISSYKDWTTGQEESQPACMEPSDAFTDIERCRNFPRFNVKCTLTYRNQRRQDFPKLINIKYSFMDVFRI